MSLFPTPPAPVEPPSIRVLIIPLLIRCGDLPGRHPIGGSPA